MRTPKKTALIFFLLIPLFFGSVSIVFASETSFLASATWNFVANFFGGLVGLAGLLLNWGINEFVIGFGNNFLGSGVGVAVDMLWQNVRDIFNLTFIFGLVYLGFKMILNSDDTGTRRWLVHLILAALLVNFSLFITKFVVDMSNVLATQIVTSGFQVIDSEVAISDNFMDALGIMTGFREQLPDPLTQSGGNPYGYIFGTAILFIVTAFVFAIGGFLLIIRYAVLCIYMTLSPLMFLGWVFPQLQGISDKYWRGFLGRAFFAPIYLLMIYFAYQVVNAYYTSLHATKLSNGGFADVWNLNGENVEGAFGNTFPPFILSSVFLIAAVVIANKLGAEGASGVVSMMNDRKKKSQQYLKRKAWGATKTAAVLTGGTAARRSSYLLGTGLEKAIKRAQSSNVPGLGTVARSAPLREGAKVGAKMRNATFGRSQTIDQERAEENQLNAESDRNRAKRNGFNGWFTDASPQEKQAMATAIRESSDDEIVTNHSFKQLASDDFAKHLTESHLKALEKSGRYKNEEMQAIKEARDRGTFGQDLAVLNKADASVEDIANAMKSLDVTFKSLSKERLQSLPQSIITDPRVARYINDKQIESLAETRAPEEVRDVVTAREAALKAVASGKYTDPVVGTTGLVKTTNPNINTPQFATDVIKTQQQQLMSGNAKQVGQLPVSVFIQSDMAEHITPQALEERLKNGKVSNNDLKTIEKNIKDHINNLDEKRAEKTQKMWQKWSEQSTVGLGADFDFSGTGEKSNIITGQNVAQALKDRDQNQ